MTMFHGVEIVDASTPFRPLRTVRTAVIGIAGAAEDLKVPGRHNVPVLLRSEAEAAATFRGTLGDYCARMLRIAPTLVIAVNAYDPATHFGEWSDPEAVDLAAGAAVVPGAAGGDVEVSNAAADTVYVLGTDYTFDRETGTVTRINGGGIGAADATLSIRTRQPSPSGTPPAAVAGAEVLDARTGLFALLNAASVTRYRPGIVVAPDYSGRNTGAAGGGVARGVGSALQTVANRLRASFVADGAGADSPRADAIAARALYTSRRGLLVWPWVQAESMEDGTLVDEPASVHIAAGMAARDLDPEFGFWWSPSNMVLPEVRGTSRPVSWGPNDLAADTTVLDAEQVMSIARIGDAWRSWGNRSLATPNDAGRYKFFVIGRVADAVGESLLRHHLAYVDAPSHQTYWDEVSAGVAAYLRELRRLGAIRSGSIEASDANTAETLDDGRAIWRVRIDPPPPLERLTFELTVESDGTVNIT